MASWKDVLAHFAVDVEDHFDQLKYSLGARLGLGERIMIQPYRGFGTPQRLYLKGRVLEDEHITPPEDNDSLWDNLVNMYRRMESDEIPHARLVARVAGAEKEVEADEEGYFEVWLEPSPPVPAAQLWQPVVLELTSPQGEEGRQVTAEGKVFIPPPSARFGVISDIDDTVLQTDAAHLLHMARTVFLGNARTRLPFEGVAAFYRALFKGAGGNESNPLFYVSSSPWNLYDLLSDFFNLQDIPIGPILMLRDWGISDNDLLPFGHMAYKLSAIHKVLEMYQEMKFILIGDSGQEDPEIYAEVVRQYPQRILAVYIRNVSTDLKRPEAIRELAKKVAETGSTLILADNTLPMAQHAAAQSWIDPQRLAEIEQRKQADEAPPSPVEKILGVEEKEKTQAPTVVVEAKDEQATKQAVDAGAIESALDTGKEGAAKPPTVVDGKNPPPAKPDAKE